MTPDQIRSVLVEEAESRVALEVARAELFLDLRRGRVGATEAWQRVTVETQDLRRRHEVALVEKLLLWHLTIRSQRPDAAESVYRDA